MRDMKVDVRTYLLSMRIIELNATEVFWLVVQKSRRESAHAHHFQFKMSIKSARMRGFSSRFLDSSKGLYTPSEKRARNSHSDCTNIEIFQRY